MTRWIVLGSHRDVDNWRRSHGLTQRQVIPVTPQQGRTAARGISGPCELVELDSWKRLADRRVQRDVKDNLNVLRAIGVLAS